jgi:hypothetical protein
LAPRFRGDLAKGGDDSHESDHGMAALATVVAMVAAKRRIGLRMGLLSTAPAFPQPQDDDAVGSHTD